MLMVEATQRKAVKWRGGVPKLPDAASQVYDNYWRAMRQEYAVVSAAAPIASLHPLL
jgi:hypothetical protein